mgnify:CR=1 FL=1
MRISFMNLVKIAAIVLLSYTVVAGLLMPVPRLEILNETKWIMLDTCVAHYDRQQTTRRHQVLVEQSSKSKLEFSLYAD